MHLDQGYTPTATLHRNAASTLFSTLVFWYIAQIRGLGIKVSVSLLLYEEKKETIGISFNLYENLIPLFKQ